MRIFFLQASFCAIAGVISYFNSSGGRDAFILSVAVAAIAGAAVKVSSVSRGRKIARDVTGFAKALISKQFPRYVPAVSEGTEEMTKTLNLAAQTMKNRFETAERQKARLSAILNATSEGVLCVSPGGRITMANTAARAMLAADGDITGKNYWEAVFSSPMRQVIRDALESDAPVRREIINLYPSKNFYMASAVPPAKKNGELVLVLFDSTEFKKLETAQKDLITNISHEIRTPLTSIVGAAENICERTRGADSETVKLAAMLERNSKRLAELCSRVITLAELEERSDDKSRFISFNLAEAAVNAAEIMRAEAERKNITVEVVQSPELPMKGDRLMIENMLVNLIENAVKHSPDGGRVEVSPGAKGGEVVKVSVRDRGEGIERKDIGRIFERFYRGAQGGRGNGLGLSIARQTVEIHGGAINVESEPGKGSVFTVDFERAKPEN